MVYKPTHLHYSTGRERLCGEPVIAWPDKYMGDAFARTLPMCPNCLEISKKSGIQEKPRQITYTEPKSIPEPVTHKPLITLSHYLD